MDYATYHLLGEPETTIDKYNTTPKINMSPKKELFQQENNLPTSNFQGDIRWFSGELYPGAKPVMISG